MRKSDRKIYQKIYIIIGLSVCILAGLLYLVIDGVNQPAVVATPTPTVEATAKPTIEPTVVPTSTPEPTATPEVIETVDVVSDDSIQRMVNRDMPISSSYVPSDLTTVYVSQEGTQQIRKEAAEQLQKMFTDATNAGYALTLISGYRSYSYEEQLYQFYVNYYGKDRADEIDCQPGYSEHQLGLAVDIGAQSQACRLDECFASMPEGQWLQSNAHKYGYILRYPQNKKDITGIIYSPWNYRYVGIEEAEKLYLSGLTMEEYYGVNE